MRGPVDQSSVAISSARAPVAARNVIWIARDSGTAITTSSSENEEAPATTAWASSDRQQQRGLPEVAALALAEQERRVAGDACGEQRHGQGEHLERRVGTGDAEQPPEPDERGERTEDPCPTDQPRATCSTW